MRTCIRVAALVLSGAMFIGCDKKDNTPAVPPAPTVPAAPTTPSASDMTNKVNGMIDKGTTAAKTEADKVMPASMPTVPALPTLPK